MKLIIFIIIAIILYLNYKRKMLISSSSIWVVCYLMIFVVYPLAGAEEPANNEFLIDVYAFFGILMFWVGIQIARMSKSSHSLPRKQYYPRFWVSFVIFLFFAALTISQFISQFGIGSISNVIIGSTTTKMLMNETAGEVGGLYGISLQIMMPTVLAVWVSAKSKKETLIKIGCAMVFIVIHVLFSFTRIFLITFIAVILCYELRNKPMRKQALIMGGGAVLLVTIMVVMNFLRTFGMGGTLDSDYLFDLAYVFESTDFGASYFWFDKLLDYGYPGISPLAWFKFLFVFIPRSIWPGKPEPLSLQILNKVDPSTAATGYSTAGNSVLGEGYAIIGDIGIFLFPLIWGIVCETLDKRYQKRLKFGIDGSASNLVYYLFTIFVILSAQRGDWSQYMTIFLYWWVLPLFLLSRKKSVTITHRH